MSAVEELRKLLAEATPGPWRVADFYDGGTTIASMRSPHETVSIDADEPTDIERVAFRATAGSRPHELGHRFSSMARSRWRVAPDDLDALVP